MFAMLAFSLQTPAKASPLGSPADPASSCIKFRLLDTPESPQQTSRVAVDLTSPILLFPQATPCRIIPR